MPTVEQCIAYIVSTGWTLERRSRGAYVFHNPRCAVMQWVTFTLRELRDAQRNGW